MSVARGGDRCTARCWYSRLSVLLVLTLDDPSKLDGQPRMAGSRRRLFSTWSVIDFARASGFVLVATWSTELVSSLWLDELGTYWVISDSFSETWKRAWEFQGQSPLTYEFMWVWKQIVGGQSDAALRLLPVLFGLGSLALVFSIVKRLSGRESAWIAIAVAVSIPELTYLTVSLRPYPFGFFFFVLSTRLLIVFVDSPRRIVGVAYAVTSAAAIWSAYYFVFGFASHVLFVGARRREGADLPWLGFIPWVGLGGALVVPLLSQIASLRDRSSSLQFLDTPGWGAALSTFIPLGLAVSVVLVGFWIGLPNLRRAHAASSFVLFGSLAVLPSLFLYAATVLTDLALWTVRYRMPYLLGFSVLVALLIGSYGLQRDRKIALIATMFIGLTLHGGNPLGQDWRGAISFARANVASDGLVIVSSGFVEARSIEALEDRDFAAFLAAPLSRYEVGQQVLLAPSLPAEQSYPYILKEVNRLHPSEVGIVYVAGSATSYEALSLYLADVGYELSDDLFLGERIAVLIFRQP